MSGVLSLKPSYYEALRRLTLELAGINLGKDHRFLIETRLGTLARQEGFAGLPQMIEELFSQGHARLALQVVSSLLERDTHFNPDLASMKYLESHLLPSLANIYQNQRLRILSFGCSTGQETYSIAIQLDKSREQLGDLNCDIVGIDYPSPSLERAKRGQYTHFEVQRGLPARDLITYFSRKGEDWVVNSDIRSRVSFQEHHLMSNLSTLGHFHLIIFRNRLPSYASAAQIRLIRGLSGIVHPLGYLMLGSGEQLPKIRYGFDTVAQMPGIFQRRAPAEPVDTSDNMAMEAIQTQRLTLLEKAMIKRREEEVEEARNNRGYNPNNIAI